MMCSSVDFFLLSFPCPEIFVVRGELRSLGLDFTKSKPEKKMKLHVLFWSSLQKIQKKKIVASVTSKRKHGVKHVFLVHDSWMKLV